MTTITTRDGTHIFYKDWGPKDGQPIIFSHGWPLSADTWDAQMVFFANNGFRTIAHDRRSHGRSDQVWHNNNMDQYADDLAELIEQARSSRHHSGRPFHRRRRGHTLYRSPWYGPRRQDRPHRRGAAADAEDGKQCHRPADRCFRRHPQGHLRQSQPVLQGFDHSLLRLQPRRRRDFARHPRRILASGHDGRAQGSGSTAFALSRKAISTRI